jgi:hypothetical protein
MGRPLKYAPLSTILRVLMNTRRLQWEWHPLQQLQTSTWRSSKMNISSTSYQLTFTFSVASSTMALVFGLETPMSREML